MLLAAGLPAAASALPGHTAETVTMAAPAGCHWEYAQEQLRHIRDTGGSWSGAEELACYGKAWEDDDSRLQGDQFVDTCYRTSCDRH